MKKKNKKEIEVEPEFIILDERARVFAGCREGYPFFSEDMDEAKPLQGQSKFDFMQRYHHLQLEQMFLENVREKRRNRKTRVSI
jgi:hypothetical protein